MSGWSNQRAAKRVVLGYVGAVTLVFMGVAVALVLHQGPDASFAPVLAVVVTLPASLVLLFLPRLDAPWDGVVAAVVLVAAALVQAWSLWLLFRGRRRA